MTPAREAVYLPLMALTVALLGGLRIGAPVVLLPPSLFALVLGLLLMGVLIHSGALAPDRLLSESRPPLANVNGFLVLVTLFFASAQTFAALTPDAGLPRALFSVYFLILMLNTLAARPDRVRVLQSLAVTFGAAFVLNFVVLDALSDPEGGRLKRVLQVLLEGITLGALSQPVHHPATGYITFFAIVLFLVTLASLPRRLPRPSRGLTALLPADEDRRQLPP
jgi:hypothetical protein